MATVLIAEPNAYVAELLRMTLESEGYEVETACTRAGVMGHLERRSLSAALVSLRLLDGDGSLPTRSLKRENPSLHVILMTGDSPYSAKVLEATEQGAIRCLFKPFDLDEMLTVLAKALERRF